MELAKLPQLELPVPISCKASATKQNNFRTFFVLKDQRAFPRHAFSGPCLCSPKECTLFDAHIKSLRVPAAAFYTTMQKLLVQKCFFTGMVPFKTISAKIFVISYGFKYSYFISKHLQKNLYLIQRRMANSIL